MKKFNLLKLISLIFVCAMLMGAIAVTAFAADEEPTAQIYKKNVYHADTLKLMFLIDADKGVDYEVVAKYAESGEPITMKEFGTETIGSDSYPIYMTAGGVSPQNMNTVITVSVLIDGEVVDSINYSVLEYIFAYKNAFQNNKDKQDEIAMYDALYAYAQAADKVLNKTPNGLGDYRYVTLVDATLDGNNKSGIFKLEEAPFANVVADIKDGYRPDSWYYSVDGGEKVTVTEDEIKTLTVTGDITIGVNYVENECKHENTEPATCTKGEYCPDCDTYLSEALAHTWVDATCTELKHCSVCGTEEENGQYAEHTWVDATCKELKHCSVCGTEEENGKLAHHVNNVVDSKCDVCEAELSKTDKVATITFKTDHSNQVSTTDQIQVWSDNGITFTNDRNKQSQTLYTGTSSPVLRIYAGYKITVDFPGMTKIEFTCGSAEYATTLKNAIGNTATANGSVVTVTLNGESSFTVTGFTAQVRLSSIKVYGTEYALHVWGEGEVITEASCTTEGKMTATCVCGDCNATDTITTPKLPHNEDITLKAVDATCSKTGLTEGKQCSVCGTIVVAQKTVEQLPHTEQIVKGTPASCTAPGLTDGKYCTVCETMYEEQKEIPKLEHVDENGDGLCDYGCGKDDMLDNEVILGTVISAIGEEMEDVTVDADNLTVNLPTSEKATVVWNVVAGGDQAEIVDGQLVITLKDSEGTVTVKATVTVGEASRDTKEFSFDIPKAPSQLTKKTYSYTFTSKVFSANGSKTLNGVSWTLAGDGGFWGNADAAKGQQFGSKNAPYKSLTLTSDSFSNVSQIKINTSGASSINATLKVYVGDTLVGSKTLTSSATEYTFDVKDLTGEIRFEYTNSSSKAIYIKSINVSYAE